MTDRTTIYAVDGGDLTGVARFAFRGAAATPVTWYAADLPADEAADWLGRSLVETRGDVHVVAERFVITPNTGKLATSQPSRYNAIEMIGLARHLARWYGHTFAVQGAGDAKKAATNERLRSVGWWVKGTQGHAIDAIRHVVLYRMTLGHPPPWV